MKDLLVMLEYLYGQRENNQTSKYECKSIFFKILSNSHFYAH